MEHKFIINKRKMIHVLGPVLQDGTMVPGKGYLHAGYVWVFSKTPVLEAGVYPQVFLQDGNLEFVPCKKGYSMEEYGEEMIRENTMEAAMSVTPDQIPFSTESIEAMNSSTSSYKPVIEEDDDFLKRIIKATILLKELNVNRLKANTKKDYILPNLISGLRKESKTSVKGFSEWVKLLNVDFLITIHDRYGKGKKIITYYSKSDMIHGENGDEISYGGKIERGGGEVIPTLPREDFLKRLIKTMIFLQDPDDSEMKSKVEKPYDFTNLKAGLKNTTKMSVRNFLYWLDLMELEAEVIVMDNGQDKLDPLKQTIHYHTDTDKLTNDNGEVFQFYQD